MKNASSIINIFHFVEALVSTEELKDIYIYIYVCVCVCVCVCLHLSIYKTTRTLPD